MDGIKLIWPQCVIAHGVSEDSNDLKERLAPKLSDMMGEKGTEKWSSLLRFLQWEENNREDEKIRMTPHSAR